MSADAVGGNWTRWTEDQKQESKVWGVYHGFWLGPEAKMRPYRDMPQGRIWAGGISSGACQSDACKDRIWIAGGSTLDHVLSDVWSFEMEDYAWVKVDTPTKPNPPRFKSAFAMYEPLENNKRLLLAQPHLIQVLGVRDFLGGNAVTDVWVLTQTDNTNPSEIANKGSHEGGEWHMDKSGTMYATTPHPHAHAQPSHACNGGAGGTIPLSHKRPLRLSGRTRRESNLQPPGRRRLRYKISSPVTT